MALFLEIVCMPLGDVYGSPIESSEVGVFELDPLTLSLTVNDFWSEYGWRENYLQAF
jgi:hypothetical protein